MRFACAIMLAAVLSAAARAQTTPERAIPASPEGSRVTLDVKDADAREVAKTIADQTGNRPVELSDNPPPRPVTLSLNDAPYWDAVDALLRASAPGPAKASDLPRVISGPVRIEVRSVSRIREIRPPDPAGALVRYTVLFGEFTWEDRLPVAGFEAWLTSLRASDGSERIDEYATKGPRLIGGGFPFPAVRCSFDVYVRNRADEETITAIEGFVLLELAAGESSVTVADAQAAKPEFAGDKRFALRVDKAWTVGRDSLVTTLTTRIEDGSAWPPILAPYGPALVAPDGRRFAGTVTTGVPKLQERFAPAQTGAPRDFQVSFRFYNLPPGVEHWSLQWVLPKQHELRRYPFAFKDLPLR